MDVRCDLSLSTIGVKRLEVLGADGLGRFDDNCVDMRGVVDVAVTSVDHMMKSASRASEISLAGILMDSLYRF